MFSVFATILLFDSETPLLTDLVPPLLGDIATLVLSEWTIHRFSYLATNLLCDVVKSPPLPSDLSTTMLNELVSALFTDVAVLVS